MTHAVRHTRRDFLVTATAASACVATGTAVAARPATDAAVSVEPAYAIGCYTRPWDREDYRVALDAIAEAGFTEVGLMTTKSKTRLVISVATTLAEAAEVAKELKARKLTVPSVYGGGIPVAKGLKEGIAGLRRLIDSCATVGCRSLLMGGIGNAKLYPLYYKAIAECCDYAAAKGMEITLKPHGGLNATGPQCAKTVREVGHKNFRLWYDAGNIYYYSGGKLDPVKDAPSTAGLVTGWCIKDYLPPKNVMVTPGAGKVDFAAVLKQLQKGGFTSGSLVIETLSRGDRKQTLGEARKARQFLLDLTGQKA